MIDKTFKEEALMNNTFDLKVVEDAIHDVRMSSYRFLYEAQKQLTGYKRFDFKMSDLMRSNTINSVLTYYPRKYVFFVDDNFITEKNRLAFRRSKFYNKEITFYDTNKNPEIFSNGFVLFVDGKFFLDGINILCKEDKTYFIFNIKETESGFGIPKDKFDKLMADDADITVYYVPNSPNYLYNTNGNVLIKYKDNGLPLTRFDFNDNALDSIITFVAEPNSGEAVLLPTTNDDQFLYIKDGLLEHLINKKIGIHMFKFRYIHQIVKIRGGAKFFELDKEEMPIPIENCMVFSTHGEFMHNIKIKPYYPNIYEVVGNDNDEPLDIYVFYFDENSSILNEYRDELEVYKKYTPNLLQKYIDGTISEKIKNYSDFDYDYNIKDLHESGKYPDHFKYKVDTLKDYILKNSNNFTPYLSKLIKRSGGYYIDISKLNLTDKLRFNNKEVGVNSEFEIFDEPRYVFVFRNEYTDEFLKMRFFVDGVMYTPDKFYKNKRFEYYYIPTPIIRHGSILEIEKVEEYHRELRCRYTKVDETFEFNLDNLNDKKVFVNDVFLTKLDGTYIPRKAYTVICNIDGNEVEMPEDSFFIIKDKFKIKMNDELFINQELVMHVKKNYFTNVQHVKTINDNLDCVHLKIDMKPDKRHMRVYRNGLLVSPSYYHIRFGRKIGLVDVHLNIEKQPGDIITCDCVPYKLQEVYKQDEIPDNGYMDFSGILDKPVNFKWYDIYINGRKINKTQLEVISPSKVIFKDVVSKKNLAIYQKDRDDEYFGYQKSHSLMDDIWEEDEIFRNTVHDEIGDIKDVTESYITDLVHESSWDVIHIWEAYLKFFGFINPDTIQIEEIYREEYPNLYTSENTLMLNPEICANVQRSLHTHLINPDDRV